MVRFLIIRFSSIGDIVLTTPVIRGIKEQVEDAEIYYLTKKQYVGIVENNPYVDKVFSFDKDLYSTILEIKKTGIDYIIDLHKNLRSGKVKRKLESASFSFNKLNWEKWKLVNFHINSLPDVHIVDRYLKTTSVFDVVYDQNGLDYFIPEKDKIDVKNLPTGFQNGYVGLVIGAQHYTKKMPLEKLIILCKVLSKPIIILGGPEDAEIGEKLAQINTERIFNAAGKYNLNQSASLVEQANVIICHDTGLMHIAAAFKKKIISLWGNTVPEFGMYPFESDVQSKIFEVKDLKCRPCSKIGFQKCPKKHFKCMNNQNIKEIASLANTIF